jgi:D-inositol-3-phosphate glycosyltransferase
MKQSIQVREHEPDRRSPRDSRKLTVPDARPEIAVALLTGGIDRPYVFGLSMELISKGAALDLIGSDTLDFPEFHGKSGLNFLNLQGSQRPDVSIVRKVFRLLTYYARLIRYAAMAEPKIFHILWNNKLELFDRTVLTLFYKLLGKRIVLTVHNVNAGRRDSRDSYLNRLTLRIQYQLADHVFVHTEAMKVELNQQFGVQDARISVIPFPINNAVRNSDLTPSEARRRLGIQDDQKAILFFGRITPYKGLEYLIAAFQQARIRRDDLRLIIAGRPENDCQDYWRAIQEVVSDDVRLGRIVLRADHIPDDETEIYFKAADVLVLPYKQIYQSGVMFLGFSFGLPVIASDVGALKDEIVEGKTGFVFKTEDSSALATTIERYFESELFSNLDARRQEIREFAVAGHSWDVVGRDTMGVYGGLLRLHSPQERGNREPSNTSLIVKGPS